MFLLFPISYAFFQILSFILSLSPFLPFSSHFITSPHSSHPTIISLLNIMIELFPLLSQITLIRIHRSIHY